MKACASLLCVLSLTVFCLAQGPATGFPPYGSFEEGRFDAINLQNLNVNFSIPIVSTPGRGMDFNFAITYDSSIWANGAGAWYSPVDQTGNQTWGWKKDWVTGITTYTATNHSCHYQIDGYLEIETTTRYSAYAYTDRAGTKHAFNLNFNADATPCNYNTGPTTGYATDNSGYYIDATNPDSPVVTDPTGIKYAYDGTVTDTNGNYFTKVIVSSTETDWKDTRGLPVLKIIYGSSSIQYQYYDPTGAYQTTTLNLQPVNIKTNFGCSGVTEYTGTANFPASLDLPNGKSYQFTYEQTPGFSGYYTGRVYQVTLPTGGYYQYQYAAPNDGINCSDSTGVNLTKIINDGSSSATWGFWRGQLDPSHWQTIVTAPQLPYDSAANQTWYTFTNGVETSRTVYQSSAGLALRTINTTWAANGTPASKTTILEDAHTQSKVVTSFDTYGNLTSLGEYDWGYNAPGGLIRTTTISYLYGSNPTYANLNMRNRVSQVLVQDASGTTQSRTDIGYDGTALSCVTGAPQHDDYGHGCSYTTRGNQTSVTKYITPATVGGPVTKNFTYDSLGNLRQADADCCQQLAWAYSSATQYAFPDSVMRGGSLTTTYGYEPYTGLLSAATDENGQITHFGYDILKRLTQIQRPDAAYVTYSYDDTAKTVIVSTPVQNTDCRTQGNCPKQITYLDGLGRTIKSQTTDPSGASQSIVETQYDPLSRAYKVSNPHNSTAQYWTETDFDALGRPLRVIPPDSGATTTYTYSTTAVTVTDGAGKQRKSVSDGLGRLVTAYEPDVANGNSLTQQTSYAYTVLDALATVTQGVQTRTFTYDGLGRLTSQTTPEANGVGYQYNNFNLVTQRTDARGVVTTYGYDALNRLNQISYNVGSTGVPATASVNFAYGTSSASFNNGRLLTMTDGLGSETYTYDQLGRVIQLQKVLNGTGTCQSSMPCNIVYAYNLANELTSITYPSGRVVNQSYDSTARLTAISNGGTGSNYASGFGYNPAGQVTGFNYGNGVAVVFGYSPQLLQLATLGYSTNTQTLFSLSYGYVQNGGNNGQITSINDGIQPGRTANYTYDALNRLGTAVTNGSTGYSQWGLSWTYDRYGNRTAQTPTAGTAPSSSLSVNPTSNRINSPGFTYDANGNLTVEPLVSNYNYSYDAANRLVSFASGAANATYAYDGHGRRAQKVSSGNTTVYIFSGPRVLAEYLSGSAASSPSKEYVYVGSTLLTTVTGSAATYHHRDHLSIRISTNQSADVVAEQGHFPYGESWYLGTQSTQWQFTDYERDAESGNDYATFRYYVSRQGRFLTLDPLAGTASNPQSWNRYAYVRNDPCSRTDPLGLAECDFNVQFNNDAGLGDNQTTAIQQRINQIYGAVASPSGDTVGVKFNFSGKADATLTATNASWFTNLLWKRSGKLGPLGSEGGLWGPPKIYMNNLPTGFPAADTAMQAGGVGAHELAHLLLGSPDLPYDASNPNLLMFYTAPEEAQFGALVHPESALWKLTSDQVSTLFRKCSKAHPTNNPASSGGHGGGGGGNEFWFEDWLLGMMESLFGGGGSTEVVTHRFID